MWARLTVLSSDPECVVLQLEGKFFFYLSRKEPREVEALHCAPGNMCRPENKACLERWKGEREARAVRQRCPRMDVFLVPVRMRS